MEQILNNNREKVTNYLVLRQSIGIIGIVTPFALPLVTYALSDQCPFQVSISHYYYSVAHVAFIGALCLLSAFLLTYRGIYSIENRVSNFAGGFALGVATFPTYWEGFMYKQEFILNNYKSWFDKIHYVSATLLFICFAIFCLKIFQLSDEGKDIYDMYKIRRNKIYKTCGIIIVISISIIAIIWGLNLKQDYDNSFIKYSTFIFESTSLLAFGLSWLVKGSVLWSKSNNALLRKIAKFLRGTETVDDLIA